MATEVIEQDTVRAKAYLSVNDTIKLGKAALRLRDELLIQVFRHTGCRVTEALLIQVNDVDFITRTITVKHLKKHIRRECPECDERLAKDDKLCSECGWKVDGRIKIKEEQEQEWRTLPVDDNTLLMIREYIALENLSGKDKLFVFTRQHACRIVKSCAERANLPKIINRKKKVNGDYILHNISPHQFRKAFITNAIKKINTPVALRQLQEIAGHANISTTMDYVKLEGSEQRKYYDTINPSDEIIEESQ